MKMKIYGAGSIGNHLAHAARSLGWDVIICDIDYSALERTKNEIYPSRYGQWDQDIGLYSVEDAPCNEHDLIFIGTPPDTHIPIAIDVLKNENPKALLIEKPLCGPELLDLDAFIRLVREKAVRVFIGYDHVVGKSMQMVEDILSKNPFVGLKTIDVEFREHWGGIFNAHHWLSGPSDSYLGFYKRGGGALGEHSHALNLWQHLAHVTNNDKVSYVSAEISYKQENDCNYDEIASLNLLTYKGILGRCIQDVVTSPSRKWARVQYENGFIEWQCNFKKDHDLVKYGINGSQEYIFEIYKTRPDDFIEELKHIEGCLANHKESPNDIIRGIETMKIIKASHLSALNKSGVVLEY